MTRLATALLALLLLVATGAYAAEPRASLPDIEDEVMCPICGTALNLSEAPQAERQREFIRRQIAAGKTKEEIKDALVAEYGRAVLATPRNSGFDLTATAVPVAGIFVAGVLLLLAVRRWRRRPLAVGAAPPAMTETDARRLDADSAKYDL